MAGNFNEENVTTDEQVEILQSKYISPLFRSLVTCDGVTVPKNYLKIRDEILNLETRPTDVFVCGFPKCGTIWTTEMVWCIANDLDFEGAKLQISERFPFLERSALIDHMKTDPKIVEFEYNVQPIEYLKKIKGRRFIKSHLPLKLLPKGVQREQGRPKVIYVTRHPRDSCVSNYHFAQIIWGFKGSFDEMVTLFMSGKVLFGPFGDHVAEFWKIRNEANILFLTYEEMKRDLASVIIRVAEFLDKELNAEQIRKLEQHLSFESMRSNRAVNREELLDIYRKGGFTSVDGKFMRSGKTGDYLRAMSEQHIQEYDEWFQRSFGQCDFNMYNPQMLKPIVTDTP